jgi:SAM-dependent methyltransferase
MLREGYQVTADFESTYWWFLARRELVLLQVARTAKELGFCERPLTLLDFGCGTGFNLPFLAKYGRVYGADVADESLKEFQKTQDFPLIDLRNDTRPYHRLFNILTALDVLEHMDDDVDGLRRMKRFLAPQGQVILTVPAYRWLWSGEDVISHHKRRYTKKQLVRCCRLAGYEVLFMSYFNCIVLPGIVLVIWTKKLFLPNGSEHSDLQPLPSWLNTLLHKMTSLEARWVGTQRQHMPAGASIICRLKPIED